MSGTSVARVGHDVPPRWEPMISAANRSGTVSIATCAWPASVTTRAPRSATRTAPARTGSRQRDSLAPRCMRQRPAPATTAATGAAPAAPRASRHLTKERLHHLRAPILRQQRSDPVGGPQRWRGQHRRLVEHQSAHARGHHGGLQGTNRTVGVTPDPPGRRRRRQPCPPPPPSPALSSPSVSARS